MKLKTVHTQVFGKVQGVFFRDCTQKKALELQVTGWVRNCHDGSVEAVLCGTAAAVDEMIQWLHLGSPHAEVTEVVIRPTETQHFPRFEIRY